VTARSIAALMRDAAQQPAYPYPWRSLEPDLARQGRQALALVAYGSLVNPDSAAVTLGHRSGPGPRPVVAHGVRRIFNVPIPADHPRYGPPVNPRATAVLNLRMTGAGRDAINGVLLSIAVADLPALRDREEGYDLYPVACTSWENAGTDGFVGYVLVCPDTLTDRQAEPHRRYYEVCREGAAGFGSAFLAAWLANTYLADGVTPVERWEREASPP